MIFKESSLWADAFYKSKCLPVCLSVRLFTFELPFKRLLAPTSRSWMSKVFKDLESLGKSNVKKWSQILKLLLTKGVKLPHTKKLVFGRILKGSGGYTTRIRRLYNKDQEVIQQGLGCYVFHRDYRASPQFFWYQCYYPHQPKDVSSPVCWIF